MRPSLQGNGLRSIGVFAHNFSRQERIYIIDFTFKIFRSLFSKSTKRKKIRTGHDGLQAFSEFKQIGQEGGLARYDGTPL